MNSARRSVHCGIGAHQLSYRTSVPDGAAFVIRKKRGPQLLQQFGHDVTAHRVTNEGKRPSRRMRPLVPVKDNALETRGFTVKQGPPTLKNPWGIRR